MLGDVGVPALCERLAASARRNAYLIEQAWAVDAALIRLLMGLAGLAPDGTVGGYSANRAPPTWIGGPSMSSPLLRTRDRVIGSPRRPAAARHGGPHKRRQREHPRLLRPAGLARRVAAVHVPAFNRERACRARSVPASPVAAITRVRDTFLDQQVQAQTTLQGQWETRDQELAKVEAIFPEPSDSGLGNTISQYYARGQDVASEPTSTAARTALTEQARTLAMQMNSDSTQLGMIASGIDTQVSQQVTSINDLATQIAGLNGQIQRVTVTGANPNDLLDQREQLLEQLSAIVPTSVAVQKDGSATVEIGGTDLVSGVTARQMVAQTNSSGPRHSDLVRRQRGVACRPGS